MIVIMAEKPDVANKIAAALDKITLSDGTIVTFGKLKANEKKVKAQQSKDGYLKIKHDGQECYVTWAFGHLCELKQAKDYNPVYKNWRNIPLPYIPKDYEIQLVQHKDTSYAEKIKKQFEKIENLFNKADYIINATDFDREGEVIFAYIYELAKCTKPVKRACFSSQTETGIKDGFTKNLKDGKDVKDIELAGRMRGIADWVVGANISVAMTLKQKGLLMTVGRVQTPTLTMLVDKEKAIRDFKSEPYWTIEAEFTTDKGETFKAKHSETKIMDKSIADALYSKVNGHNGIVSKITKKSTIKEVPLLYSLSALQMDANSKFGFSLAKTLEIAQKLYDNGYTTYPRTNSQYLTSDMRDTVNDVLDKISGISSYTSLIDGRKRVFDKKFFDDTKVESHFAIIPTGNIPKSLSADEEKVFDLICRSVIKMLYSDATIENTKAEILVNGEKFSASGSVIAVSGWMEVGDASKVDILPLLKEKDVLLGAYNLADKKTEPPKRYTDKTILAAMLSAGKDLSDAELRKLMADPKTGGIGTEATRASIINTLITREYIIRDKKTLIATDKGIDLIDKLPLSQLKSAELTAKWEQRLNNIARGKENADKFREDFENEVKEWVKEIDSKVAVSTVSVYTSSRTIGKCPICGEPVIERKWGYSCDGYKKGCKFTIGTICGKKLTTTQAKQLVTTGKSPLIKGFTSKAGKKFNAVLVLDEGKISFSF